MADKDPEGDGPSLELPSFSFGRKKKAKGQPEPVTPAVASPARPQPVIQAEPEPARPAREFAISAIQAALAVGAIIGLLAVLLTVSSLKLCEGVRGTDSCGGGPGLLLLVATLVVLTYVGGWLLRAFGIGDPGSTSFLAVGLIAVTAMLFLLDVIYNWWMVIVIPIVAMAAYALSWWVTTRVVDVDE